MNVLAEPRDSLAPGNLVEPSLLDVGDEQARRVRPEIDRGDPRHLRGYTAVSRPRESCASCTAARRTAVRASEPRSLARLASSFGVAAPKEAWLSDRRSSERVSRPTDSSIVDEKLLNVRQKRRSRRNT